MPEVMSCSVCGIIITEETEYEGKCASCHDKNLNDKRANDDFPAPSYFPGDYSHIPLNTRTFNADRKIRFLRSLAKIGVVTSAARAAGVGAAVVYKHRKKDEVFAAAWDDALASYADSLEMEAYRRAVHGVDEPVYYKGEKVGVVRRYSDQLLGMKLKGRRPEIYKERVANEVSMTGKMSHKIDVTKLSDEQLNALEETLNSALVEDKGNDE